MPYIIHVCRDGMVTDYTDHEGIEWAKREMARLMEEDPGFVKRAVDEFYKRERLIHSVWQEQKTIWREELANYYRTMLDAWPWYEVIWWVMDFADPESEAYKLTQAVRIATEFMNPSTDILTRKSLRAIYPQFGEHADYLLIEEFSNDVLPSLEELKARKHAYAFANASLYTGARVEDVEQRFNVVIEREQPLSGSVTELHGDIGCKGVVRGRARIVMRRDDVPSVEEGEILIAPMTMPDYIAGMKRAAAFVTDEGGVVSHAAIVAREMGKPCLLNTRHATRLFKDGDMVEVDADQGILRKL